MNHEQDRSQIDSAEHTPPPETLQVDVGRAMPPAGPAGLPRLHLQVQDTVPDHNADTATTPCVLADGLSFVGNALLRGPCSVAGTVQGNLTQAADAVASVVVDETGFVKGDITAQKISVMGRTEGVLDAGQGEVSLHDTASVIGVVRYGRIQVNGANLNATLERVVTAKPGA
jgi:cytoskeletal protein CcmA (bactofilin family)